MNIGYSAQIVDTLRLRALEKERMEAAKDFAESIELEYEKLTMVKVYDGKYVYAVDMDERFEHEAVAIDADGDGCHTFVYSSRNGKEPVYFVSEELSNWRHEFYLELLKIAREEKGHNGFDERWLSRKPPA